MKGWNVYATYPMPTKFKTIKSKSSCLMIAYLLILSNPQVTLCTKGMVLIPLILGAFEL